MEAEILNHLTQHITLASTNIDPYHYFHAEQIFPEKFYVELIDSLPDASRFSQLNSYSQRSYFNLLEEKLEQLSFTDFLFWRNFVTSIGSLSFASVLF